jgi:hypothetical protein
MKLRIWSIRGLLPENKDILKQQISQHMDNKIINRILLAEESWKHKMDNKLVLIKEMNSLLLSMVPGEDYRRIQTRSSTKEFQKVITPKLSL